MTKPARLAAFVAGSLVLFLAVVLGGLYVASRHEPEFYARALETDPDTQDAASDAMLQSISALAGDVRRPGRWQAVFTAEEINGWAAVDLVQNHPDLLSPDVRDPRVAIRPGELTLAYRATTDTFDGVVTVGLDVFLPKPNVVAVRIRHARAGLVPLPLESTIRAISDSAREMDLRLQWRQIEGDPVALVTLPPLEDENRHMRIETVQLGQGELYIAGTTE